MNNINLDPIIRTANSSSSVLNGEETLISIDRATGRAIEKTFFVRALGNFQDYIVANNLNPLHTANAKAPTYYVRDTHNGRTLAIDISLIAINCPPRNEAKLAEALHGQQAPGYMFDALLKRWIGEFITAGEEWRFIENFNVARDQLQAHIANRAASQTGLDVTVQVTLSGEDKVAREIVVGPIEIGIRLLGYTDEQKMTVEAGLALDPQHYVNAFVFNEKLESPEELFKRKLKEHFFQHVTFDQFTYKLRYPNFKDQVRQALNPSLKQVGRTLRFINFSTTADGIEEHPREFVAVDYNHEHVIHGRTEPVTIQNTVQLYCQDSVAFKASKVDDLEGWVKNKLNATLKSYLIGQRYVDLLLRFKAVEEKVRRDIAQAAAEIGYRVDHLVSAPNLEKVKDDLTNVFPLETEADFETSMDKFKVQLKFNIRLCIPRPRLGSIERYLNPGTDVKEAIEQLVLSEAQHWMRKIHPERFYLYFNKPNEGASDNAVEDEKLPVKELLRKKILEILTTKFSADVSDLTIRLGRSDLTERYHDLCFTIRQFRVEIESPDPQNTEDLTITGSFELLGVHQDERSWRRFSVLQLDLDGLTSQLETHLKAELKTYYASHFMYQNRIGREHVFSVVRDCAETYMHEEFGLRIHLTNLDRNTTQVEKDHRQFLIDLENEKLQAETDQYKLLVGRINQLKQRRYQELSVFPINTDIIGEFDQNIEVLEKELEKLRSPRFRSHPVAGALADQRPDELPPMEDPGPSQKKLRREIKARLAG
jgi:hypothetical protein